MSIINRKNRKIAGRILIVTGCLIIVFVIAINLIDLLKSSKAINDFRKLQAQIAAEKKDDNGNVLSQNGIEISSENPDMKDVICLLGIPKINLLEAVKEGSTKGVLSSALGHVENTALPGENGNCCIAGHRNYVFGKYFNRLEEVVPGDLIEIETLDSLYVYEVDWVKVVEPEDVSVLNYEDGNNLTLITCTPFMVATHRLIVHATLK